jgi:hypothetical protein
MYQFSTTPQSVRQVTISDVDSMPFDTQLDQSPGWQYILMHSLHSGKNVTAVCLSSREQLLAVGDDSGGVSIVDIQKSSSQNGVQDVIFGFRSEICCS